MWTLATIASSQDYGLYLIDSFNLDSSVRHSEPPPYPSFTKLKARSITLSIGFAPLLGLRDEERLGAVA